MASAGIASQTKLPPSPEVKGLSLRHANLDQLPPPNSSGKIHASRLRSIARYESFHPQTLACSPPLLDSYSEIDSGYQNSLSPTAAQNDGPDLQVERGKTSLGAVAGPHGVALFRLSKPHAPLMILSHASSYVKTHNAVTSLCFQPEATENLYLASARGAGILVWDVTGHSLSPLCGRLGIENASGSVADPLVTSLAWKTSSSSRGYPWLAATTSTSACLWDLRQSPGSSSSPNSFKPSLRFGVARKTTPSSAPYIQIACSTTDECAVLDGSGFVRIFDTRMTDRTRMSVGSLCSFVANRHAGVGISYFRTTKGENCWVTWGLDSPSADPIVKVWMTVESQVPSLGSFDDFSYTDILPGKQTTPSLLLAKPFGYRLVAECSSPNLACARVCPSPVENSFITVSLPESDQSDPRWHADLWKLKDTQDDNGVAIDSNLEKVVSFQGPSESDKNLSSAIGKSSQLSSICASEVALSSYAGPISLPEGSKDGSGGFGLILCCLTESGLVTTHTIPEALPDEKIRRESKRLGFQNDKTSSSLAQPMKMFPSQREVAVTDAARVWGKPKPKPSEPLAINTGEPAQDVRDNETKPVASEVPMQFDMDVPVAYTLASTGITGIPASGISDLVSKDAADMGVSVEEQKADSDARDAAALMESIETDRIPCPRLCGATFGPGVGVLAAFHNGDVGKMWHWWERTDPTKLAAVPGMIGEPSLSDAKNNENDVVQVSEDGQVAPSTKSSKQQHCPRTLKDLTDMIAAAKEAQWGEQESEASSTGFRNYSENFFEDSTSSSSNSSVDNQDERENDQDSKNHKRLYDSYFGDHRRPLAEPPSPFSSSPRDSQKSAGAALGLTSDMLTPLVKVSHTFDTLTLSGQSILLAKSWELGDMYVDSLDKSLETESILPEASERTIECLTQANNPALLLGTGSPRGVSEGLPAYRAVLASPKRSTNPKRAQSDPSMTKLAHSNELPRATLAGKIHDDERGVHGGEYAVRPNMQESMVFLRKLFTHQQQQDDSALSFQSHLSPPDGPMLPKNIGNQKKTSLQSRSRSGQISPSSRKEKVKMGAYAIRQEIETGVRLEEDEELTRINDVCLHNASVCFSLNQREKGEVWNHLAEAVQSRYNHLTNQSYNGWGGVQGDALGIGLVDSFLRYYESLGDVQMLSTIVCVLRGGKSRFKENGLPKWYLLMSDQDERYDTYIRRYSDLLYGWGLLSLRAELNKHLARSVMSSDEGALVPKINIESNQSPPIDDMKSPGIAVVFKCPRCAASTEFGTNFCRSCQDYAFRCAMCDNAVRGLFTVCDMCGHGGHFDHLKSWFANNKVCPSGCGCSCRISLASTLLRENELGGQQGTSNRRSFVTIAQTEMEQDM